MSKQESPLVWGLLLLLSEVAWTLSTPLILYQLSLVVYEMAVDVFFAWFHMLEGNVIRILISSRYSIRNPPIAVPQTVPSDG